MALLWTVGKRTGPGQTVNYGFRRPLFWADAVAWWGLWAAASLWLVARGCRAVRPTKRAHAVAAAGCAVVLLFQAARSTRLAEWRACHFGATESLRGSMYPFQLAHMMWTEEDYLRRRDQSSTNAAKLRFGTYDHVRATANVCYNARLRNLHRALRKVRPSDWKAPTTRPQLVVSAYGGVRREGALLHHWIDHHLRLGFDYVHLYLDPADDEFDGPATQRLGAWGHRVRVFRESETRCGRSQACCKGAEIERLANSYGWMAWIDVDEFVVPTVWDGPSSLLDTMARLRSLGYCDVAMKWLRFGDSGFATRPADPLSAFVRTAVPRINDFGKSITWSSAMEWDTFQHEALIRRTAFFCKRLDRFGKTKGGGTPMGPNRGGSSVEDRLKVVLEDRLALAGAWVDGLWVPGAQAGSTAERPEFLPAERVPWPPEA